MILTAYDLHKRQAEFFHLTPEDEEGQRYHERNENVEITLHGTLTDNVHGIEYKGCQVYGIYINQHELHEIIVDTPDGVTHFVEVPYTLPMEVKVS